MRALLAVELCWSADADRVWRLPLAVEPGSTIGDVLFAARLADSGLPLPERVEHVALLGERVALATPVADGDRIELLRPLLADPKDARRARVQAQRKGTAPR